MTALGYFYDLGYDCLGQFLSWVMTLIWVMTALGYD